ncbi:MAG: LptF/LptG family permease, partial [Vitreoscilla sp.]|nr:LptF/LptG family permease [Polaromonas sp.]
ESENGKATLKISDFEEYGSNTGGTAPPNSEASDAKLLAVPVLLRSPTLANLSELAWRLGLALAAVNFVVLAVALASVNPRGGRSGNLVFVVLTFLVYNNLVNLGQSWVYGGAMTFENLLLFLHGGVLLLGLLWLGKRNNNWTLRSALRKRSQSMRSRSSP